MRGRGRSLYGWFKEFKRENLGAEIIGEGMCRLWKHCDRNFADKLKGARDEIPEI